MTTFEGCPGSRMMQFNQRGENNKNAPTEKIRSQLVQWPIQMHLINPTAPYYRGADVLLTADCVAYALGDFHREYLKDKSLAIACPKLDEGLSIYQEKIQSWFEEAEINTLTVLIMEVPCCMGLLQLARQAAEGSRRKVPIKTVVVGVQGDVLKEAWDAA